LILIDDDEFDEAVGFLSEVVGMAIPGPRHLGRPATGCRRGRLTRHIAGIGEPPAPSS
jgi:hypothetical protein